MLQGDCPTPGEHADSTPKRNEIEQVEDAAEGPKPFLLGPYAASNQQFHSSEVNRHSPWAEENSQIESFLKTPLNKEGMIMANHFDPEAFQVGLPDQESRSRDVAHDPCSDQGQTCQSKDPVVPSNCDDLQAKSFVFPDSRNIEERKFAPVSAENAEVDESFSGSLD